MVTALVSPCTLAQASLVSCTQSEGGQRGRGKERVKGGMCILLSLYINIHVSLTVKS